MTAPRFYCPQPLSADTPMALPENAARHACRVLRLRVGDELVLFDGGGGEYAARIAEVDRQRVSVDVLTWRDVECEAPIGLTLVQALQAGEKMDMTMQKAVEHLAVVLHMALDDALGGFGAHGVGGLRRHGAGIDRIEIAPGGQRIWPPA